MSYWVSVNIEDAKGKPHCVWDGNYTMNLAPAWRHAGAQIHEWENHRPKYVLPHLTQAIEKIQAHHDLYKRFEPDNGWGDVVSMVEFLKEMAEAFERWPDGTIHVDR